MCVGMCVQLKLNETGSKQSIQFLLCFVYKELLYYAYPFPSSQFSGACR